MSEHMEVKVIYMSLFYFWFTLDAPLRGIPYESLNGPVANFCSSVYFQKKSMSFYESIQGRHFKYEIII